ncbi:WGR domain-containing protein [Sulfurimonas sp.]|uniref:WGR domain-containing protein n=1 Tax=Sulfurimonas sp. TaxID=2022749 RepID=UPI0025E189DB|nr:WGR domain-containing protein [Sulfurimonas sp.]
MTEYQKLLQREVNGRLRYYKISIYPTLFDEYLLEREFGSFKNKKPTRIIKKYFQNLTIALDEFNEIYSTRIKRGYI